MSFSPACSDASIPEHVVRLGEHRTLLAIASAPPLPRGAPAVLLVNAGVIHRIGPHRLHVRLARRLAQAGHAVLRMDLSGIGDSGALPDQLGFRASSVADIRTAIDHLSAGDPAAAAIVFGICSGADNALAAAEADPRIVGLVLVDPPCYATTRARLRTLRSRLRDPAAWAALPAKLFNRVRTRLSPPAKTANAPSSGREPPPLDEYRRQLTALVARDVRILSIYSSAQGVRYNHTGQLYEWFPELRGRLDNVYYPGANHTFTEVAQQAVLISTVMDWCRRRFPGRV
ncbi:MAG: alpha/beta fold hydrolase [Lysobacteraceae bacterium]